MATEKLCKNTLYFGFKCLHLTNELGDLQFLLLEGEEQTKIKLFAKLKRILWRRFLATFTIEKF